MVTTAGLSGGVSIATGGPTTITWDRQAEDDGGWFAPPSTTITVGTTGKYILVTRLLAQLSNSGFISILVNGSAVASNSRDDAGGFYGEYLSTIWQGSLSAADALTVQVFHNSPGNIIFGGSSDATAFFSAMLVG